MPVDMKETIAQAAHRLLTQKQVKKLTVKDIVEECQITRQAFYYHFADIPELVAWVLERESDRMLQKTQDLDDLEKGLRYFLQMAINAAPYVKKGMNGSYRDELEQAIGRMHGRIRLSESARPGQLKQEIQTLETEQAATQLALQEKLQFSRSETVTALAGASNDIEQATKLARAMITRYGMSEEFDMVAMETVNNQYLGGDTSLACSADTQKDIDRKVVELVKSQHEKARRILEENRQKLDELAQYLYEKETITGDEFMKILAAGGDAA